MSRETHLGAFEREEIFGPHFLEAVSRATKLLERDQINIDEFADLYGEKTIRDDKNYVVKMEKLFKEDDAAKPEHAEHRSFATVLEGIMHEQIELSDWLGPETQSVKTSRFDDIAHGIDEIVEFVPRDEASSHLALAIDVTFSSSLETKISRIAEKIKSNKLGKIKYFMSDAASFRGERSNVPHVVVGAERKHIKELSELWMNQEKQKLAAHPFQFILIEEILSQLHAFASYAHQSGMRETALAYGRMEQTIRKMTAGKKKPSEIPSSWQQDRIFLAISSALDKL